MRGFEPLLLTLVLLSAALAGCLSDTPLQGSSARDPVPPAAGANANSTAPDGAYAPGWPALSDAKIRPGVNVADGSCTSNFLFKSPDNRTLYLGTAAHCVDDLELGDPVEVAGGLATGTLAYSSWVAADEAGDDRGSNDFALIELPPEARNLVHPAMFTFGGPTGIATDVSQGDKVLAHGNSSLRPDATPNEAGPREGYVTHHSEWETGMYLLGPGVPGDSGSAVLTADGKALGVLVTLEILPEAASNNVANLHAVLAYANEHSSRTFHLVTHPLQDEGRLPTLNADV